ncbi:MAG TPA: hypothetical protein VIM11_27470 [Tepidisphaeraceae bacterium]|jgi:hypothetical protein
MTANPIPLRPNLSLSRADSHPIYQLRVAATTNTEIEVAIWQLPSTSTPRLQQAERTASLAGRPWRMMESRITKRLRQAGISIANVRKGQVAEFQIDEDLALTMALLFRVLAPMRSVDRIKMVADGIDKMSREEAGYWLGMAVHRVYPRRVLAALRVLLTTP